MRLVVSCLGGETVEECFRIPNIYSFFLIYLFRPLKIINININKYTQVCVWTLHLSILMFDFYFPPFRFEEQSSHLHFRLRFFVFMAFHDPFLTFSLPFYCRAVKTSSQSMCLLHLCAFFGSSAWHPYSSLHAIPFHYRSFFASLSNMSKPSPISRGHKPRL